MATLGPQCIHSSLPTAWGHRDSMAMGMGQAREQQGHEGIFPLSSALVRPHHKITRMWSCWSKSRRCSEGWSPSAPEPGWESWDCPAWRREGSESPSSPFQCLKRLQESWRGTLGTGLECQDTGMHSDGLRVTLD